MLDSHSCDSQAIDDALRKQSTMEDQGQYRAMGEILVASGSVTPEALQRGLHRQWVDMLSAAELFQSLSGTQVAQIARVAEDRTIPKNTTLFSLGDPGETYWLLISGEVRVFRPAGEKIEVELARLEAGDGFGEMALLTGEPRSASVATIQASRFLVIHKNEFDQVVSGSPELTVTFARILADRLTRGNVSLEKASVKERAYQRFVSDYQAGPQIDLVGKSRLLENLRRQCDIFAGNRNPVLLSGPPGTEKKSVSWYIHQHGATPEEPFLYVDIKNVNIIPKQHAASPADPLQIELAQDSTLFGHQQGALPFAKTNRLGLLQVGNGGTVFIDNIESLSPSIQEKLFGFLQTGRFAPLGGGDEVVASLRIICGTATDLEAMVKKKLFKKELSDRLAAQTVAVVPLRRRKKDLGMLVEYLVGHYSRLLGKSVTGIGRKAYSEIMAYDWPGNMDELEVVIRRAVNLASGDKLAPEDLFIGLTPAVGGLSFNLLQFPKVKKMFMSSWFPAALQYISGIFFLGIFFLGFWGTRNPDSNIALVLAWGIWEPALIISTLFAARLWCSICPVGGLSSLCSRYCSLKLPVPQFIRKYGFYLSGLGLGIIIWAEVAAHMTRSPRATALLIISIALSAIVLGMLYRRRAWCRYLCPLGKMVGVFAGASMLELRANYGICNNDCMTHSCYTGGHECEDGCPMFEGPFSLRSNLDCVLCGNCIKNCPNHSPQVNLRLPGFELLASRRYEKAVGFLVPLIIGTQIFRSLDKAGSFSFLLNANSSRSLILMLLLATVTLLTFLAFAATEKILQKDIPNRETDSTGMLSYGMLSLVLAFEMAFHLERLLLLGGQLLPILGRQFNLPLESLGASGAPWAITALQVLLVMLGSWGASAVLPRVYRSGYDEPPGKIPFAWRLPVLTAAMIYIGLFIAG